MKVIIINNCSNRKTGPKKIRLNADKLPKGDIGDIAKTWKKMLNSHSHRVLVKNYYCGRGIKEINTSVKNLNAEQWIISAGLGLLKSSDTIPAYDLTISGNTPSSIKPKIDSFNLKISDWWESLSKLYNPTRSLKKLIEENQDALIILCLPNTYFNLVKHDLSGIDQCKLSTFRLIGPTKEVVPRYLQQYLLPYDERLDGPNSTIKGTRSDFPQRATRHFSDLIKNQSIHPNLHHSLVEKSLNKNGLPKTVKRTRLSDSDITIHINRLWNYAEGKSHKMLRILRDEELIACEQKRFSNLFNDVKQKRNRE